MTSLIPILLACFVHLMLHTTLFIHLEPNTFEDTPIFGSQIFYLSVMDLLCSCEVIPEHWKSIPRWGKFILETIVVFFIGEISMVGVWLSMELLLVELIIQFLYWTGLVSTFSRRSQMLIIEISTVLLGIIFSVIVAVITNRPAQLKKIGRDLWGITNKYRRESLPAKKKVSGIDSSESKI
ncbi:uncharacterized protein LOC108094363 [Drosophila ficusphila]|uniref:uncharacterized protein LOC108094363 n=1 Tax=Drosophila ficusphila TaxID=30025 RepID=UPI0007E692DA|nr:uncharacterized protein LOC108094363 [Drosophila ficusphila]